MSRYFRVTEDFVKVATGYLNLACEARCYVEEFYEA